MRLPDVLVPPPTPSSLACRCHPPGAICGPMSSMLRAVSTHLSPAAAALVAGGDPSSAVAGRHFEMHEVADGVTLRVVVEGGEAAPLVIL